MRNISGVSLEYHITVTQRKIRNDGPSGKPHAKSQISLGTPINTNKDTKIHHLGCPVPGGSHHRLPKGMEQFGGHHIPLNTCYSSCSPPQHPEVRGLRQEGTEMEGPLLRLMKPIPKGWERVW